MAKKRTKEITMENHIHLRVDAEFATALKRAAVADQRAPSTMARVIVRDFLVSKGYL